MDYIAIEGVRPYDGRYEFDDRDLTTREWGWIKRLSGYLPATVVDAVRGSDPELTVVFAAIALFRAGKIEAGDVPDVFEKLIDAPFGSAITMETDVQEVEEEGPPPPSESSSFNGDTSGPDSPTNSETSPPDRKASGTPALATSEYGRETSAT